MTMKGSSAAKIVGAAMAIGGTAMLSTALMSSSGSLKRKAKKTANKAMDAAYSWITNMTK